MEGWWNRKHKYHRQKKSNGTPSSVNQERTIEDEWEKTREQHNQQKEKEGWRATNKI